MRLHYYRFPDTVDAQTSFINGTEAIDGGDCKLGRESCRGGNIGDDGYLFYPRFLVTNAEDTLSSIFITRAGQLLRKFGGNAWTLYIERYSGVFETTAITLGGNNSRHKYNRYLRGMGKHYDTQFKEPARLKCGRHPHFKIIKRTLQRVRLCPL